MQETWVRGSRIQLLLTSVDTSFNNEKRDLFIPKQASLPVGRLGSRTLNQTPAVFSWIVGDQAAMAIVDQLSLRFNSHGEGNQFAEVGHLQL
jgi:hypothetical protein